jgi:hypothetical protein
MIPVFERAKTVHALDRAATVIGQGQLYLTITYQQHGMGQRTSKNQEVMLDTRRGAIVFVVLV